MDTLNLKTDFIQISVSRIITLIVSMISTMLLARLLSLKDYGTYSQILLVVNLSNSLIVLGLPSSINFFLVKAKDSTEKSRFLSNYYTISTMIGIISGVLLVFITPGIIKYFDNNAINSLVLVLLFLPWAYLTMASLDGVLVVNKKTSWLMIFKIAHSMFILGAVSFAMMKNLNLEQYMKLYVVIESIFAIIVYILAKSTVENISFQISRSVLINIFRYSVPIGISGIVGTISLSLDKLLIGRLMTTEHVALYANAGKELPIAIITTSLTTVLLPRFISLYSNGKKNRAIEIWRKSVTVSFALMCFFTTYLIVYAPQIVTLLYSDKYLSAVGIFRIYSLILLIRCTYFGMGLSAVGKTKYIMYISIFALILNYALNLILFNIIGFEGPAVATVLSTIITAFAYVFLNSKVLEMKIQELISVNELIRIVVINLIFGVIVYTFFRNISISLDLRLLKFIIISLAWFVCYIFVIRRILIKNKDFLD